MSPGRGGGDESSRWMSLEPWRRVRATGAKEVAEVAGMETAVAVAYLAPLLP